MAFRVAALAVCLAMPATVGQNVSVAASPAAVAGPPSPCASGCSGHGRCSLQGVCLCESMYAGMDCGYYLAGAAMYEQLATSQDDASICMDRCSSHGACQAGACICEHGWSGTSCATEQCGDCGDGGECVAGVCMCKPGFFGPACRDLACPNGCFGHGSCSAGQCQCYVGWEGQQCELSALATMTQPHQQSQGVPAPLQSSQVPIPQQLIAAPIVASFSPGAVAPVVAEPSSIQALPSLRGGPLPARVGQGLGLQSVLPLIQPTDQLQAAVSPIQPTGQLQAAPIASSASQPGMRGAVAAGGRSDVLQRAQVAVQSASASAQRLLAVAAKQSVMDATIRIQEAKRIAQNNAAKLPLHEFQKVADLASTADSLASGLASGACGLHSNCSGHGSCSSQGVGLNQQCICHQGWQGTVCDVESCDGGCGANGICISGECLCNENYFGKDCTQQRCTLDCSGHGYCFNGRCQCTGDYGGESCLLLVHSSNVVHFKAPTKLPKKVGPASPSESTLRNQDPQDCPANCHQHGECEAGIDGPVCSCYEGYSGISCDAWCPEGCSGHGHCIHGACLCNDGFSGHDCQTRGECNAHGSLVLVQAADSSGADEYACTCDAGWSGNNCDTQVSCPDPLCSGHGTCSAMTGMCMCWTGFHGPTCEHTLRAS